MLKCSWNRQGEKQWTDFIIPISVLYFAILATNTLIRVLHYTQVYVLGASNEHDFYMQVANCIPGWPSPTLSEVKRKELTSDRTQKLFGSSSIASRCSVTPWSKAKFDRRNDRRIYFSVCRLPRALFDGPLNAMQTKETGVNGQRALSSVTRGYSGGERMDLAGYPLLVCDGGLATEIERRGVKITVNRNCSKPRLPFIAA